jgi:hypothetical protein
MLDDLEDNWQSIAIVALLIWLGTKAARALKTLATTVERAQNFGLTDEEDKKAVAVLGAKDSTLAQRKAASQVLRFKFDGAVAAGYGKMGAVVAAGKALDVMDHAIAEEEKLAIARAEWEKRRAAKVIPITRSSTPLDESAPVADPTRKKKGPATK